MTVGRAKVMDRIIEVTDGRIRAKDRIIEVTERRARTMDSPRDDGWKS